MPSTSDCPSPFFPLKNLSKSPILPLNPISSYLGPFQLLCATSSQRAQFLAIVEHLKQVTRLDAYFQKSFINTRAFIQGTSTACDTGHIDTQCDACSGGCRQTAFELIDTNPKSLHALQTSRDPTEPLYVQILLFCLKSFKAPLLP